MKTAQINISINTKNAIKSIGDLNNEIGDTIVTVGDLRMTVKAISDELESTPVGTDRWYELRNAMAETETKLKDYELSVKALNSEQVAGELSKVAMGFVNIAGGLTLIGVSKDSVDEVMQSFAKVEGITRAVSGSIKIYQSSLTLLNAALARSAAAQSAMSAATAAGGNAASGAAVKFRALGAVIKANPIAAIATALLAVVSAVYLFTSATDKAKLSTEDLAKENERLNRELEKGNELLRAREKVREETQDIKNATKLLLIEKELVEVNDELIDLMRAKPDSYNEQIKLIEKITAKELEHSKVKGDLDRAAVDREIEQNERNIQYMQDEKDYLDRMYQQKIKLYKENTITLAQINEQNDITEESKRILDEKIALAKVYNSEAKREAQYESVKQKEINRTAKITIDADNRIADLRKKINDEVLNNIKSMTEAERKAFWELNEDKSLVIENDYKEAVQAEKEKLEAVKKYAKEGSQERINAERTYNETVRYLNLIRIRDLAEWERNQRNISDINRKNEVIKLETEINNLKIKMLTSGGLQYIAQVNILHEKEKELVRLKMEEELDNESLKAEEKTKIRSDYNLKLAQMDAEFKDKWTADNQEEVESEYTKLQLMMQKWQEYFDNISQGVNMAMDTYMLAVNTAINNQTAALNEAHRNQERALKDSFGERLISREEYDVQLQRLDIQKENKERALRKKSFDAQKKMNIVNAVMSGAQAVLQALASMPPPLSFVMAALNGALSAVQIGIISSQTFTGNRGGKVPGQPSDVDSVNAMLAPGEMVINAQSSSMFPELLSSINQIGGGIPLAPEVAGNGRPVSDNIYERRETTVKAYVVESELSNSSRRVKRMEESATF